MEATGNLSNQQKTVKINRKSTEQLVKICPSPRFIFQTPYFFRPFFSDPPYFLLNFLDSLIFGRLGFVGFSDFWDFLDLFNLGFLESCIV